MAAHLPQGAAAPPMATFVARCFEEVALEGRCGIPLRAMFDIVDPSEDVAYRQYAWNVLRSMRGRLQFHHMERSSAVAASVDSTAATRSQQLNNGDTCTTVSTVSSRREPPQPVPTPHDKANTAPLPPSPPRRKRKWSTTLAPLPLASNNDHHDHDQQRRREDHEREHAHGQNDAHIELPQQQQQQQSSEEETSTTRKQTNAPSARRTALKKQRRLLTSSTNTSRRQPNSSSMNNSSRQPPPVENVQRDTVDDAVDVAMLDNDAQVVHSNLSSSRTATAAASSVERALNEPPPAVDHSVSAESTEWIYRSPRGFVLGVQVDASALSYADAMTDAVEGVLGVVACDELRLQYLGVTDPSVLDTLSPQFDLLEMIGRARARGENAAMLASSLVFGDARKLHYLLDMLLAGNYIEKRMVTADQKRFNILHLARFTSAFHPSMVSPSATMEREAFPKKLVPYAIAELLRARGERTCVFADIGRELGYDKRYQEKLRKIFFHEMHVNRAFPLELFMARCNTGASDYKGRKLWCIRLRHAPGRLTTATTTATTTADARRFEPLEPPAPATIGPTLERGLMEQVFAVIERRGASGATIPEIRDVLGVPTFKLPYRLAQGLIAKYNLTVRQVVVGKSTMYRMFVPDVAGTDGADVAQEQGQALQQEPQQEEVQTQLDAPRAALMSTSVTTNAVDDPERAAADAPALTATATISASSSNSNAPLPSTMKAASRNVLVSSTAERRRQHMLERIRTDKIVAVQQLRAELMVLERDPALAGNDLNMIDSRSIRRILDEFEAAQLVVSLDITLPPRRVLQKTERVVKCVCLTGFQRDRDLIRAFVDAYVEEKQQRYLRDLAAPVMSDVVVETTRSRSRRAAANATTRASLSPHAATTEVVQYNAASYKMTRMNMNKLQKQARRLGMFVGPLYRCRMLHILLWSKIDVLRATAASSMRTPLGSVDAAAADTTAQPPSTTSTASSADVRKPKCRSSDTVFTLHDVVALLSLKEYLQLAGINDALSESDEHKVRMATVRGDSWEILSPDVCHKIRGCEGDRFSRIVRTLIALGLIDVAHDSSSDLLSIFQSSDFDAMVSQVASATLSGGLLKLKHRAHITIKRGDEVLHQLPTQQSYVYASTFSRKSRSDRFVGRVPLAFAFETADDAVEYWKALQFLSTEGARLGSGAGDGEMLSGNAESDRIRSAPLKDHNLYAVKSWVPRGVTNHGRTSAKHKAEQAIAEPMRMLKRKRFQNTFHKQTRDAAQKKPKPTTAGPTRRAIHANVVLPAAAHAHAGDFRRLVTTKQSVRASKWTLRDDLQLMDAYIAELSCKWFIEIPLALQCDNEALAFRNASLERSKISWQSLAKTLGKSFKDCYLRVNELMTAPAVRARVETTKVSLTQMKNPGGVFHEERAIACDARLAALMTRALQIMLHERTSYYPLLADMLISQWTEREVKLVWRYLWLAGLITRVRKPTSSEQHERGFCIHARVHEMKYLNIAHYPISVFYEAAEYASFVQENVKEAAMLQRNSSDEFNTNNTSTNSTTAAPTAITSSSNSTDENESECVFEYELEPNASAGQTAAELSAMALGLTEFVPEYVEMSAERRVTPSIDDAKRAMAVKGVAGHLAAVCGGASPDDFLNEFWTVKARVQVLSDDAKQDAIATTAKAVEAFSTCPTLRDAEAATTTTSNDTSNNEHVASRVLEALNAPGPNGLSFLELCHALHAAPEHHDPVHARRSTATTRVQVAAVRRVLDLLVRRGDVVQASAYTHARFVLKAASSIWTLHPYHIVDEAHVPGKLFFRFDKTQTIVAQPWRLLDGSPNTRAELVLKRKVVNIVMCNPGIHDHVLRCKMRKVLGLQTLRTLVDELVADDIVHARVVRGGARKPRNVFVRSKRPRTDDDALAALAPGDTSFVDATRDAIHYFPTVNCMELLGAAACDADMRDS